MKISERTQGIENEFAVMEYKNGSILPVDEKKQISAILNKILEETCRARCIPDLDTVHVTQNRVWCSNGSCIYIDLGKVVEYATPECRRIRDLVAHNKAGELICAEIYGSERGGEGPLFLIKNNRGRNRHNTEHMVSYGCHESYSSPSFHWFPEKDSESLLSFLITRQILDGAGGWNADGSFFYSQRADFMKTAYSSLTQEYNSTASSLDGRALICTRDVRAEGRNLHLILGDANICEPAIFLKMGITSLALSLMETGRMPYLICVDPVAAVKSVSEGADPHKRTVSVKRDRNFSALEIQAIWCEAAQKLLREAAFASEEHEAELMQVGALWEQALSAIGSGDTEWMLGRLDYPTKKWLAERSLAQKNLAPREEILSKQDFDVWYHCISRRGLQSAMNRVWADRRIVTDEEIERAMTHPPRDTRAALRAEFIKRLNRQLCVSPRHISFNNYHYNIDWNVVGFGRNPMYYRNQPHEKHALNDALAGESEAFDLFLERFEEEFPDIIAEDPLLASSQSEYS